MQNLSFTTFINTHLPSLQTDPNFADYVKIANVLVKKYNKKIFLSSYGTAIKKADEGLRSLITFLEKYGFWDKKHLDILAKKVQEIEKQLNFILQIPSSAKDLHKKVDAVLKKEFKEYSLNDDEYSQLGIQIKGNGYQYKRNIDSDLDVLLK